MNARRALAATAAAAVILTPTACNRDHDRPPPPACEPRHVAEWDSDGWECEPDLNRNGVDDEDDAKKTKNKPRRR